MATAQSVRQPPQVQTQRRPAARACRRHLIDAGYQFVCFGRAGRVTGPDAPAGPLVEYWRHPASGDFVVTAHRWRPAPESASRGHWRARGATLAGQWFRWLATAYGPRTGHVRRR